ncbi:MAG: gluconate 2-dehydrogenase subunit 3 family protein, partial [Gemmatimonadaceae bacterium]
DAPTRSGLSRRAVVSLIGLAPVAGALVWTGMDVDRAARFVRSLPDVARGDGERAGATRAPAFFTAHEWETVRLLVDYVIPRDERSGSATDAKVPEYMDFLLAEEDASESSKLAMRGGLAWIDAESRRRFQQSFVGSTDAQRRQLLDDIAWPSKSTPSLSQGIAFFNRFRDMTASGFFSSEVGWKDLQYMGHTVVPEWHGCPQPALDRLGVSYDVMITRVPPQQR